VSEETVAIAPIRLARSPLRLLIAPLVLDFCGGAAIAAATLLAGGSGLALGIAGGIVVVLAAYLLVLLLSIRLDVEVATLYLHWIGGARRYTLARGPVTRVTVSGREAAIRPRFGAFGWALGRATLRGTEPIDLVRLASVPTVILVPTDRGRLGIAPASEAELLAALTAAARVKQRLDEVAARARGIALPVPGLSGSSAVPAARMPARAEAPRMLTGIERTRLEQRLAAERAAALAAAEEERRAANEAAFRASQEAAAAAVDERRAMTGAYRRLRRPAAWQRPAWAGRLRAPRHVAVEGAPRAAALADRLAPYSPALLPALAAGALWLVAFVTGRVDLPEASLRPIALAFILCGPAAAIAALGARAWFPRLMGLVIVTALAALLLTGRALFA
jgi:hypothetical protein